MTRGIKIVYKISDQQLLDMHWKQNMTPEEIARSLGYSVGGAKTAIHHEFKRRNLPLRNRSEAAKLRYRIKPDTFFTNKPRGENHFKWKGGRLIQNGYILIKAPTHHRANKAGYVREHILVWEQHHNKHLPDGHIVHHLNGIRDDNRPQNLFAVTRKFHEKQTYIKALQTRIRELEQLHLSL